jgi:hypothetical protein
LFLINIIVNSFKGDTHVIEQDFVHSAYLLSNWIDAKTDPNLDFKMRFQVDPPSKDSRKGYKIIPISCDKNMKCELGSEVGEAVR